MRLSIGPRRAAGLRGTQLCPAAEVQGGSPFKCRGWQYLADSEEEVVEVLSAGAGGRGGQLHCGESVPVHHPDQCAGMPLVCMEGGGPRRLHVRLTDRVFAPLLQLLDCFIIPVLMLLSWWILKTRYKAAHYVAVGLCLLGVGAMVGADLLAGRDQGSSKKFSG